MVLAAEEERLLKTSVLLHKLACAVVPVEPMDALAKRLGLSFMIPTLALLFIATRYVTEGWASRAKLIINSESPRPAQDTSFSATYRPIARTSRLRQLKTLSPVSMLAVPLLDAWVSTSTN